MTLAQTRLEVRKIGGRIGAEMWAPGDLVLTDIRITQHPKTDSARAAVAA